MKSAYSHKRRPLKNFYLFGVLLLLCFPLCGQQRVVDSLKAELSSHLRNPELRRKGQADTTRIGLLIRIGEAYTYLDTDSLRTYAQKAVELTRGQPLSLQRFQASKLLGEYHQLKGNYDKSVEINTRILEVYASSEYEAERVRIYNNLATAHVFKQDYNEALKNYLKGIELAEELNDYTQLSQLNDNTAQLFLRQENYKQALIYFDKAIQYDLLMGNELSSAITRANQAFALAKTGKFLSAMRNVDQSISYFEKSENTDWLAYASSVKARIYQLQNRPGWAIHWFEKCRELHKKIDDPRSEIELYSGLGSVYFQVSEIDSALNCARRTLELSRKLDDPIGLRESTALLYRIHKEKGNVEESLEQLERLYEISKKNYEEQSRNNIELLETKASFEKNRQIAEVGSLKTESWRRILFLVILAALLATSSAVYFLIRDKKKQKRLFRELRARSSEIYKREKELEALNQTKDRLFSIIGHDLRGPVGALQEMLNLCADEDISSEELLMHMPKLKSDVDNVAFTLNNLLSWGQSQMNGIITKPRSLSLRPRVDHCVKLLTQQASQKDIKIYKEVPESAKVWADAHHIDIILRNLMSNAIKFTPQHGLVHVEVISKGSEWQIRVRDTGIGMDADTVERFFQADQRFTTYGTREEKGTGLGVSLCYDLTLKNNGKISVESEKGKGTTIFVNLPKHNPKGPSKGRKGKAAATSTDQDQKPAEYAPR